MFKIHNDKEICSMSATTKMQVKYLLAYAAVHSLFASRRFKGLIWWFFGPDADRWFMKFFSIQAAVTLAPLILFFLLSPGRRLYVVPSPWRWMMVVGQIAASIVTALAFIDAPHRFLISQQLGKAKKLEPLNPRGIYSFIRDPFLLGGLFQMWLTPFMTTKLLVLIYDFIGLPFLWIISLGKKAPFSIWAGVCALPEGNSQASLGLTLRAKKKE